MQNSDNSITEIRQGRNSKYPLSTKSFEPQINAKQTTKATDLGITTTTRKPNTIFQHHYQVKPTLIHMQQISRNHNETQTLNNTTLTTIFQDNNIALQQLVNFYTFCAHTTTLEDPQSTGKILENITETIQALRKLNLNIDAIYIHNQHNRLPFSLLPTGKYLSNKQLLQNNNTTRLTRTTNNYTSRQYSDFNQGAHNLHLLATTALENQRTNQNNQIDIPSRTEQIEIDDITPYSLDTNAHLTAQIQDAFL